MQNQGWLGPALLLAVFLSLPARADIAGARNALEQYRQAHDYIQELLRAGNAEEAQQFRLLAQSHLERARDRFEAAHAQESAKPEVLSDYAAVLHGLAQYDLAAEALARAVTFAPEVPRLYVDLGANRLRMGPAGHEGALEALRRALALDPGPSDAAAAERYLGDLYYELALYEAARRHYEAALEHNAEDVWSRIAVAVLDARAGAVRAASGALDALGRAAQPYDAETRVRLREALWAFEEFGRTFPDEAANHEAFGRLLYRAGRLPGAVLALRRANVLAPENTDRWNFLGAILNQMGRADAAREAYERSLELNPDQPGLEAALQRMSSPDDS